MQNKDPRTVYADIIGLPHHQAEDRKHMSLYDRAAQFAPFAALVGYDEMVKEEARLTDRDTVLSEEELLILDGKLEYIADSIRNGTHPEISVIYFEPDQYKDGGCFKRYSGTVKRIDFTEASIVFFAENGLSNGKEIPMLRIKEIKGAAVDFIENRDYG